jgi:hypothetical protein
MSNSKINHTRELPPLGVSMPISHTGRTITSDPSHAMTSGHADHGHPTKGPYSATPQARPNIARSGAAKRVADVPVHSGMHSKTRDGNLVVGVTHTTLTNAPDASGKSPLDPTVPGKRLATPATVISHRSRTRAKEVVNMPPGVNHALGRGPNHDLGRAILEEAFAASSFDDRFAHGRG